MFQNVRYSYILVVATQVGSTPYTSNYTLEEIQLYKAIG